MPFEESKLKIIDASFSIPDSPKIPENFKETIRACLQKDPVSYRYHRHERSNPADYSSGKAAYSTASAADSRRRS